MPLIARRVLRYVALFVAGLSACAIVALLLLRFAFDPNRLKPRLESLARERLQRELTLSGDLRWQLGSHLVLESRGGALGAPAAFDGASFARWESLRIDIALWPLLRGDVEVDALDVRGLQLRLVRRSAGAVNWRFDALQRAAADGKQAPARVTVGRIALEDALIAWSDGASGADWRIEALSLRLGLPVFTTGEPFVARGIEAAGRVYGGPLVDAGVPVAFAAERIEFVPAESRVVVPALELGFANARATGALSLQAMGPLRAAADLTLSTPSLRSLLAAAGVDVPSTRDPAVLGQFDLRTALQWREDSLVTDELEGRLDATRFTGRLAVEPAPGRALRFALQADGVQADGYLEPEDARAEPFALHFAQLQAAQVSGRLGIGRVELLGTRLQDVVVDVE